MPIRDSDALIVVDVQNDFCPGGALAVENGDQVVAPLNGLIPHFNHVVFTRDWHPSDHCSFSESPEFKDYSWPPHCVQNSPGAEFHGDLLIPGEARVVNKGADPDQEAYEAFSDSDLAEYLRGRGVERVYIGGLATDYCVKFTALAAVGAGFETWLIEDACKGIAPETVAAALSEVEAAGVRRCYAGDVR